MFHRNILKTSSTPTHQKTLLCSQKGHGFRPWLLFLQTHWNLSLCFVLVPRIPTRMCSGKTAQLWCYSKALQYVRMVHCLLLTLRLPSFQQIPACHANKSYAPPITEFRSDNLTDDSFKRAYTNAAETLDFWILWLKPYLDIYPTAYFHWKFCCFIVGGL